MKVRIDSDGTSAGTRITDEDGNEISVTSFHISGVVGDILYAEPTTVLPQVHLNAEARLTPVCPYCGRRGEP